MSEKSAADDPLIAALIGRLPKPGSAWPRSARINWLRMLVMGFNETYGLEEPILVSDTELRVPVSRGPLRLVPAEDTPPANLGDGGRGGDAVSAPRYVIDQEGFAMCGVKPIAPEDVPPGAIVWDERREGERGDLASILWKGEGSRDPAKLPKGLQVRAA
jgi:hypothetical protein